MKPMLSSWLFLLAAVPVIAADTPPDRMTRIENGLRVSGDHGKRRVNSALYTWQDVADPYVPGKFTRVDTPK